MKGDSHIKIVVLGNPVSQLRPILSTKGANKVTVIDPPKTRKFKEKVAVTAKKYLGVGWELLDVPLQVRIDFYREIPKSWSKKKTEQAVNGEILPRSKPDVDNYIKAVLDGLTGVAWKDDNIIIEITGRKHYSKVPRTEVRISIIEDN